MRIAVLFLAFFLTACTALPAGRSGSGAVAQSGTGQQIVTDRIVFDTSKSRIDLVELAAGGPPIDGIAAIDRPLFTTAAESSFPKDADVLGVVLNGEAKAYPVAILNWHEVVNDTVGGISVAVTYSPLCDTTVVIERKVGGKETTFGVSGKLFQNCLVLYDRLSKTLWSQPWGIGIVGEYTDVVLKRHVVTRTDLASWLRKYPASLVLSRETGYKNDYDAYPYTDYRTHDRGFTPIRNAGKIIGHPKDRETIFAEANGDHPFGRFSGLVLRVRDQDARTRVKYLERITGRTFLVQWNRALRTVQIYEGDRLLPTMTAFAFVYPALFQ